MTLYRNPDGTLTRTGKVRQERTYDFWTGALPAGLEVVAASTGAAIYATTPQPRSTLTTAATVNDTVTMQLAQDIDLTGLTGIWVSAQGLALSHDTDIEVSLRLGTSGGVGVTLFHGSNTLARRSGPTDVNLPMRLRATGWAGFRFNQTLRWDIRRQIMWALQDDGVMAESPVPSATLGLVRPGVRVRALGAATRSISLSTLAIGYEHN